MIASRTHQERSAALAVTPTAVALLSVMKLKRVGRRKALQIIDRGITESDEEACREWLADRVSRMCRHPVEALELQDAWRRSREQLYRCQELGVRTFSFHDHGYPERLRKTPDPPAVLFVKGNVDGIHAVKSLAVVGTREPTDWGAEAARRCSRTAAEAGFVIVSGLAHGCDTNAHEGCLDAGGVGVAVLAHGLEKVYPAANRDLAERLLAKGGCVTSEYPVGMRPSRQAFAERDRIQSGLSDAVYVIETDVVGGTMHTVRFARDQNRPIACIAHPKEYLVEPKTRGNQKLIREDWATAIPDGEAFKAFMGDITPIAGEGGEPPAKDEAQAAFVF